MARVTGSDVFNYIAFGFFVVTYSILAIASLIVGFVSLVRNKLFKRRIIFLTCVTTFLICVCKVIQMGSNIVNIDVDNVGVTRGFGGVADIMDNMIIPCLTLFLAMVHLYYLTKDTIGAIHADAVIDKTTPWLPKNTRKILNAMVLVYVLVLVLCVIPAITLKILSPIIRTDGLATANTGFQNYFNQIYLYIMAFVGLVAGWYFDAARDCAENSTDSEFMKRARINLAYLFIFELYNLYTYISPGNVLLIGYVVGTLLLSSAHVCNRISKTPYYKQIDKRSAYDVHAIA
jgi:hypothetical protein